MYAVGWTMHTVGSQIIRTAAILQLLLGNIGRPGGGINALRGHANVQGATDHAIVAGILPGYLRVPRPDQTSLATHLQDSTPKPLVPDAVNYWGNYPKFYVSQMKTWFGEYATAENDFAYHYLGKPAGDATWLSMWDQAYRGKLEGFIALGFNPLLAGPDVPRLLQAMSRLQWKVVIDPFLLDSAEFWKAPGMKPEEIDTEVLYLPSTHWIERDGSFTNSGRWAQWKEKAIDPPAGVRSDTWILSELFWRMKELYVKEGGAYHDPIKHMTWNYLNPRLPTLTELAKEINGVDLTSGKQLSSFGQLRDDGTTTSGNWLYCGSFAETGNFMARRGTEDPTGLGMHHDWAFSWPLNRRVLYNRASADADGKPWDSARAGISWSGREWIGDVPDYGKTTRPNAAGAFIMTEEGVARLFTTYLNDGPLPEHYEPAESPTTNPLHEKVPVNPVLRWYDGVKDTLAGEGDDFPYACTVYRVVEREHFVTSHVPHLVELMPDFFVEVPAGLAKDKGVTNGGRVRVWSKRGSVEGVAICDGTNQAAPRERKDRVDGWHPGTLGVRGYHGRLHGQSADAVHWRCQHPVSRVQGVLRESGESMSSLTIKRTSASEHTTVARDVLRSEGPTYAKLVDISRCIGCKGCEVACKEWNDLKVEPTANFGSYQSHMDLSPNTWLLMRFNEIDVKGDLQWLITKDACLHCAEPGCLYACPAPGAIVQYANGIVDINQDQCIGCQYCITGCPFNIPRFDPTTRKVSKCNMCVDRVESGLEPACVKTCPTNAIMWGSKDDMVALADRKVDRLKKRGFENAAVYNPAGVGGTHMMYVVPHGDRLADYGLPTDPTASPAALSLLGFFKRLGSLLFGLTFVGTLLHFLRYGPDWVEESEG